MSGQVFYTTTIMSERNIHSADHDGVFAKVTPELSAAFAQQLKPAPQGDKEVREALREGLNQLPQAARFLIEQASSVDTPNDRRVNLSFMRGALMATQLVRFIEEGERLQRLLEFESTIDDGGVAIPRRAGAPDDGPPTGVLFLAPPDPEPRPEDE